MLLCPTYSQRSTLLGKPSISRGHFAIAHGCRYMALDTAQPAQALIEMYRSWGYVEMGTCDWRPHTNYLSILMKKPIM